MQEYFRRRHHLSPGSPMITSTAHIVEEGRKAMVWIFVMFAGVAATFTALGMYAVWFKVLTMALLVAGLVIAGLVSAFLWRQLSRK
jgi:hypothetical protein